MHIFHEFSYRGRHKLRIMHIDGAGFEKTYDSGWQSYETVATVDLLGKRYYGYTEYWGDVMRVEESTIPVIADAESYEACETCDKSFTWDRKSGDLITGCDHMVKVFKAMKMTETR